MAEHIEVTLDFIPVEEADLESYEEYVCLVANAHNMMHGHRCIAELTWVEDHGEWLYGDTGDSLAEGWFVTHYAERPGKIAEIPTIKETNAS